MSTRLIIDGNAVYEIDEDCQECQKKKSIFRDGKHAENGGAGSRKTEDGTRAGSS